MNTKFTRTLSIALGLSFAPLILTSAARVDSKALEGPERPSIPAGNRQQPNILFILSDDHAAHAISAYGSQVNKTPNIDRIASEGMRFDSCFCTNSICSPSRASILTGKYSHLHGVADNTAVFDGSQQTLPKLLSQGGYRTALVGKWHLKSPPTGFDYTDILPGQGEYHNPVMIENGKSRRVSGYVTDIVTDRAIHWLKQQESSERPFLLMLHHKAPHANWESDAKHEGMFADESIPMPKTLHDDHRTRSAQIGNHQLRVGPSQWKLHFHRFGALSEGLGEKEAREWVYQVYMKNYLRCVASVDENVGRVLDYLDRSGLADNTIVIYSSDQGFFLGDHGLYDKRFMYEPSLQMPLLMRYPGHIKAGSTSDEMLLNIDFVPTLLDFAGLSKPEDLQGTSFSEIALGREPADWRDAMYYQFSESMFGIGPHEGIRTNRYKLIHFQYGDHGWELYDLKTDPDELNNLYGTPGNENLTKELTEQLDLLKAKYEVKE